MPDIDRIGHTYRFFAGLSRLVFRVFLRFRVNGLSNVPRSGGCILVANHASYLDPPVLGCAIRFRKVHFMSRDTLFRYPGFRSILPRLGAIPLRPASGDVGALRAGVRVLRAGGAVGLFPEGTRSADGEIQPVKGGLGFLILQGRASVVPAYIGGTFRAWPRSRRFPRFARISVAYGDPIPAETIRDWKKSGASYDDIAERIMTAVSALRDGGTAVGQ